MSNIASAQVLESFEKPQLYTEPAIQLPNSIPMQETKDLFTIPNSSLEIDLTNLCPENDPNLIITDKADVVEKILSDNVVDPNSAYLVSNSYYKFCFKIGIKEVLNNKLVIDLRTLDSTIKLTKSSYKNKPIIISGLVFDGEIAGLVVNSNTYVILHNITVNQSKKGIELNCLKGCLVVDSRLTGIPEFPPAFSVGIKSPSTSKDLTIQNVTISNYDIGIDAEGENILVAKSSITKNKMLGIRADSAVKNLSMSEMVSLSENGSGTKALEAFMLDDGANSNVGLIKTVKDKETFVVPESSTENAGARYVEFYRPDTSENIQPIEFLYRYDLKPTAKKGDSISLTDPRIQGKELIAAFTGADGSTISTETVLAKNRVIVVIGEVSEVDSPSLTDSGGGTGLAGGGGATSGFEGGSGSSGAFAGGIGGKSSCSLNRQSGNANFNELLFIVVTLCGVIFIRRKKIAKINVLQ